MDDDLLAGTRTAYDAVAESYARMLPDTRYEAALDLAMVEHLLVRLGPGAQLLDAGCGTGRMLTHLTALDPTLRLSGVDLSPGMVAVARRAHPSIDLAVADLAALPHPDGELDGVMAWYSIIHTPPSALAPLLGELHRVLRPGGLLLLGYQAGTGHRVIDRPYGHDVELGAFLHHTPYVCDALLRAGFTVDTVLDRGAREQERHPQGFVLARRPYPAGRTGSAGQHALHHRLGVGAAHPVAEHPTPRRRRGGR
ncbi:class I SAM-dependent DNA methyltransferase [Auraticoccus monumenti]|uniref:Methyltransferase domain-containing protein n=1 Tax=Auraticoccus monumenti TaxID=675864 RepID=A0A1G6U6I9_9ACTN|nr:class I SAM-dependent methyltransferase [Auraticoccus monumenti]SDD36978.1 Methyltransferase domain-containing protein [Auraticoccus monumenti]